MGLWIEVLDMETAMVCDGSLEKNYRFDISLEEWKCLVLLGMRCPEPIRLSTDWIIIGGQGNPTDVKVRNFLYPLNRKITERTQKCELVSETPNFSIPVIKKKKKTNIILSVLPVNVNDEQRNKFLAITQNTNSHFFDGKYYIYYLCPDKALSCGVMLIKDEKT